MVKQRNTRRGFTLIELLVVVLIIGILAAVAVPQYQKTVEKSKAAQAIMLVSTLYQAAEAYYLANGSWPSSITNLDMDVTLNNGKWEVNMINNESTLGVKAIHQTGKYTGTGFVKYKKPTYRFIPKGKNLCIEQKAHASFIFSGATGDYCKKLLGGTDVYTGEGTWSDIFLLP